MSGKGGLKTRLEGDDSCTMTTRKASVAAKAGGKPGDSSMEDVAETTSWSIEEQEKKARAEIEVILIQHIYILESIWIIILV